MDTVTVFDCRMTPPATMVRHDRRARDTHTTRFRSEICKTQYGIRLALFSRLPVTPTGGSSTRGGKAASADQELSGDASRVRVRELPCQVHRRARQPDQHVETPAAGFEGRAGSLRPLPHQPDRHEDRVERRARKQAGAWSSTRPAACMKA